MIIFVVAYWKILAVVRRQARVVPERRQCPTSTKEPVAGTSTGKSETMNPGSANDEGVNKAGSRQVRGQTGSKSLSKAQINVVRTMVYITVCFVVCWMPLYCALLYRRLFFAVRHNFYSATQIRIAWKFCHNVAGWLSVTRRYCV